MKKCKITLFLSTFILTLLFCVPVKSLAASKNYVLTQKEYLKEAEDVAKEIKKYYKKAGDKNATCTVKTFSVGCSGADSFVNVWNTLDDADLIVVQAHGSRDKIAGITMADIYKLKSISCKCLLLTGCNAAHSYYENNNIASAFSKIITGFVVASDGTVVGNNYNSLWKDIELSSNEDKTWHNLKNGGSGTTQKGWAFIISETDYSKQVYHDYYDVWVLDRKTITTYMGRKTLTINSLMEWLFTYSLKDGPHPTPLP